MTKKKIVWVLFHHWAAEVGHKNEVLGVFSSEEKAEQSKVIADAAAMEKYKTNYRNWKWHNRFSVECWYMDELEESILKDAIA